ncbi:hypothetical protein [Silvimonas sp.]|uniref:hypothetical protein n=1 Tax=Silvimonas sp. TaxID=2650811 RepID=UPI0028471C03|nr:hypothetical protein [Silvimonas sp.]MDR3427958.1 hypothetical protein [Silvimonas sp.]
MDIVLNESEREALTECSMEAFRLYVLGLRPLMDIRSGMVGTASKVSYGRLALEIQYQPPQGSKRPPFVPNIRQMRALLDELIRVGLVKRYSQDSKDDKRLAVLLLKAYHGPARPVGERQLSDSGEGQPQSRASTGLQRGEQMIVSQGERHMTEYRRNPFLTPSSSSPTSVKQNGGEFDDDENVIPDHPVSSLQWIKVMQMLGFADTSASAPALAIYEEWLKAGLQVGEVQAAAAVAAKHGGRTVQYVAKVLLDVANKRRCREVGDVEERPGKPWYLSGAGTEAKAMELGLRQWDDEQPHWFRDRIYKAAGLTADEIKLARKGSPI